MSTLDNFCVLVGGGCSPDGEQCRIYRALKIVLCSRCKAAINTGEMFTRNEVDSKLNLMTCLCASCSPFRLFVNDAHPQQQEKEGAAGMKIKATRPEQKERERVRHEIEERLGPALKRRTGAGWRTRHFR